LRQIRLIIYRLKRTYGTTLTLWNPDTATHNLETGVINRTFDVLRIRRAVVLQARMIRDFEYDLSYIAANKNFTYGGFFDHRTRWIIIDGKDISSGFEPHEDMHIVISSKRYELKEIQEIIGGHGYILRIVELLATADLSADLTVTGTLDPDITGDYYIVNTYNGENLYQEINGLFFIWYDNTNWVISRAAGTNGEQYWKSATLESDYTAYGDADGTATVSS